jgi:hypothetical protein
MAQRTHGLFRAVEHPNNDVARGGCFVYGSAGPGVDTGVLIDFEGTLFLGNTAIRELAEVAGYSVNVEGAQLEVENAHLQHTIDELTAERDQLSADLDAVGVLLARGSSQAKATK